MKCLRQIIPVLALAICIAIPAGGAVPAGGLTWEFMSAERNAPADQASVAIDFPARNAGASSVRIVGIDTSCRCVSASADPEVIEAGKSGVVHVTFAVAGRTGRFEKWVDVSTDASKTPARLRIVVTCVPAGK